MHEVTRADLSRHTTLRLGGPATRLVTATHQDELVEFLRASADGYFVLAGGSNVVVADSGIDATVVLVRSTGVRVSSGDQPDEVLVTVQAGQPWDDVVAFCVLEGFSGIECLSGIPGSAGATPIQNVGAYGQEVAETISSVRVLDRTAGSLVELTPPECGFAYRTSRFKHQDRFVVLAVTFRLRRNPLSAPIRYAELARALDCDPGEQVPLAQARSSVLALRAGKGMVLDPTDPDTYSVGSFFMNPVLPGDDYRGLCERVGAPPPSWPTIDGSVKVSAAWLIEHAGFGKGYHGGHPGVAISGKHTLALTNRGDGSTASLLALAREIRDGVRKAYEIELRPEPVLVNCSL